MSRYHTVIRFNCMTKILKGFAGDFELIMNEIILGESDLIKQFLKSIGTFLVRESLPLALK